MISKKIRKSMPVRIVLVVLALLMMATVFGCKKAVVQTGDVDQDKTEEDLHIGGEITFTINNESGTREESMAPRNVVNEFMKKYPNAIVHYEEANRTTYGTRISAGDIGDVFWCDANDANNYQRNHNALMPLDSYLKPLNINMGDIYSGALDTGKIGGRLYMVPRKIGEQILIYNETMLQAAGIQFDNSHAYEWEDFKEIWKTIKSPRQVLPSRSGGAPSGRCSSADSAASGSTVSIIKLRSLTATKL